MLIIFDLDDTLVDTSGSIYPLAIKKVIGLIASGSAKLLDIDQAYRDLLRLNTFHLSAKAALSEFLELYQVSGKNYDVALKTMTALPSNQEVRCVEGALETIKDLSKDYLLALVTRGNEKFQRKKIAKVGIDLSLFSSVHFCDPLKGESKKKFYLQAQEKVGISRKKVFVCGDRISLDLTPAKELGFKTIHIRWGRGLGNTGLKKDVDYTILDLNELHPILENFKALVGHGKYE